MLALLRANPIWPFHRPALALVSSDFIAPPPHTRPPPSPPHTRPQECEIPGKTTCSSRGGWLPTCPDEISGKKREELFQSGWGCLGVGKEWPLAGFPYFCFPSSNFADHHQKPDYQTLNLLQDSFPQHEQHQSPKDSSLLTKRGRNS